MLIQFLQHIFILPNLFQIEKCSLMLEFVYFILILFQQGQCQRRYSECILIENLLHERHCTCREGVAFTAICSISKYNPLDVWWCTWPLIQEAVGNDLLPSLAYTTVYINSKNLYLLMKNFMKINVTGFRIIDMAMGS